MRGPLACRVLHDVFPHVILEHGEARNALLLVKASQAAVTQGVDILFQGGCERSLPGVGARELHKVVHIDLPSGRECLGEILLQEVSPELEAKAFENQVVS